MKMTNCSFLILFLIAACTTPIASTAHAGTNEWSKYVKSNIFEGCDTFMPTLEYLKGDYGVIEGAVNDSKQLIPGTCGGYYSDTIVTLETCVYLSSATALDIEIEGDDGVSLFLNEEFVAGRANAEDPPAHGTLNFDAGWNKLNALVFDCVGCIALRLNKRISRFVQVMDSEVDCETPPQCNDAIDNDGDGLIDYPADPGCQHLLDRSEEYDCGDGIDNDGDRLIDYLDDPGCDDASDPSENSPLLVCDDGIDNDDDGLIDYLDDPGCDDLSDSSENSPLLVCDDGIDNDGDGFVDYPEDPRNPSTTLRHPSSRFTEQFLLSLA